MVWPPGACAKLPQSVTGLPREAPLDPDELCLLPISETSRLIRSGELSSTRLTEAVLARTDALKPFAVAYIRVMRDEALAAAATADQEIATGNYLGPLHGIPIALKDLCDVKGVPTTAGSLIMGAKPAEEDSEVARRLRGAGAVLIGKTNLHEFAYGGTSVNPHYGTPPNPWDRTRIPGGSSGGSAVAVAVGTASAALGSDTGGSIRLPAAHCGITGLKPTFGRVSRRGVVPLSMTLDHVGPMARSAQDCAIVLNAIAGHDPKDPYSAEVPAQDFTAGIEIGLSGRRIGVPRAFFFEGLDPEVEEVVGEALDVLERLGAELVDLRMDWAEEAFENNIRVLRPESFWVHRDRLGDPEQAAKFGEDTRSRLLQGQDIAAHEYHGALVRRAQIAALAGELMSTVDLLATPTTPVTAAPIEGVDTIKYRQALRFTAVFDHTWQPSLSVPCGFTTEGLPAGLMLTAAPWQEALLLRAGYAYQRATDWHLRRPNVA